MSSRTIIPPSVIRQFGQTADKITRWVVNCVVAVDPTRTDRNNPHTIDGKYVNLILSKIQGPIKSGAEKLLREINKKNIPIISADGKPGRKRLASDQYLCHSIVVLAVVRLRQPQLWQKLTLCRAAEKTASDLSLRELREKYENQGEGKRGPQFTGAEKSVAKFMIPGVCAAVDVEFVNDFGMRALRAGADCVQEILEEIAEIGTKENGDEDEQEEQDAQEAAQESEVTSTIEKEQQSTSASSDQKIEENQDENKETTNASSLSFPSPAPIIRTSRNNILAATSGDGEKTLTTDDASSSSPPSNNTKTTTTINSTNKNNSLIISGQGEQDFDPLDLQDDFNQQHQSSQFASKANTPAERARMKLLAASSEKKKTAEKNAKKSTATSLKSNQEVWLWSTDGLVDKTGTVADPAPSLLNNNNDNGKLLGKNSSNNNNSTGLLAGGDKNHSDFDDDDDENTSMNNEAFKNFMMNNDNGDLMKNPLLLLSSSLSKKKEFGTNDVRFRSVNNFSSLFSAKKQQDPQQQQKNNKKFNNHIAKERTQRRALRRLRRENDEDDEVAFHFEGQDDEQKAKQLALNDPSSSSSSSSAHDGENSNGDDDDDDDLLLREDNDEDSSEYDDDLDDAKKLKELRENGDGEMPKCYICGFSAVRRIVIKNTNQQRGAKENAAAAKKLLLQQHKQQFAGSSSSSIVSGASNNNLLGSSRSDLLLQQQQLLALMNQYSIGNNIGVNATTTNNATNQRLNRFTRENKMIGTSGFADWNEIERSYFENSVAIQSFHSLSPFGNYFGQATTVVGKSEAPSAFLNNTTNNKTNNMMMMNNGSNSNKDNNNKNDQANINAKKTLLVDIHQNAIDEWKDDTELGCCRVCNQWFHFGCILPSRRKTCSIKRSKVCTRCMVIELRDRSTDSFGKATEDFNHLLFQDDDDEESEVMKANHRGKDHINSKDKLFHGRKLFRSTMYF